MAKPAKPSLADRSRSFLDAYTHGLKREDLQRLFTRDTREAYRFFAKNIDEHALTGLSRHRRWMTRARLFFWAFTLRLSPARRVIYGVGAAAVACVGFLQLFRGIGIVGRPVLLRPADRGRLAAASPLGRRARPACSSASCWSTCWSCSRWPTGCRSRTTSRSPARSSTRCCRRRSTTRPTSRRSA